MSYRRPGQRRGSPHQAILPGRIESESLAESLLATVVGEVEQVSVVQVFARAGVFEAPPGGVPEPLVIPGLRTIVRPAGGSGPSDEIVIRIVPPWTGPPPLGKAA